MRKGTPCAGVGRGLFWSGVWAGTGSVALLPIELKQQPWESWQTATQTWNLGSEGLHPALSSCPSMPHASW